MVGGGAMLPGLKFVLISYRTTALYSLYLQLPVKTGANFIAGR